MTTLLTYITVTIGALIAVDAQLVELLAGIRGWGS